MLSYYIYHFLKSTQMIQMQPDFGTADWADIHSFQLEFLEM